MDLERANRSTKSILGVYIEGGGGGGYPPWEGGSGGYPPGEHKSQVIQPERVRGWEPGPLTLPTGLGWFATSDPPGRVFLTPPKYPPKTPPRDPPRGGGTPPRDPPKAP